MKLLPFSTYLLKSVFPHPKKKFQCPIPKQKDTPAARDIP